MSVDVESVPLTVQATAAMLGFHPNTVYRGVASGEIPSIRVRGAIRIPSIWAETARIEGTDAANALCKKRRPASVSQLGPAGR